jgi:hypothetical protein
MEGGMATRHGTSEALDEIQSAADRMGDWIQKHVIAVGGTIGGLLVLAAVASFVMSSRESAERDASTALAEVRTAYLSAMGAGPGALDVPELASPEAARRIREEYGRRFGEVADAHAGTVSGALARLEVAQLRADAGDHAGALALYDQILAEGAGGDRIRGLVLQRAAAELEETGNVAEAAARHEQAAALAGYPLRHWALADAARCRAAAGDAATALALYQRVTAEAPELRLPDHQRVQMQELEAAAGL